MRNITNALAELNEETLVIETEQRLHDNPAAIIEAYCAGLSEVARRYDAGSYYLSDLLAALAITAAGLARINDDQKEKAGLPTAPDYGYSLYGLDTIIALISSRIIFEMRSCRQQNPALASFKLKTGDEIQTVLNQMMDFKVEVNQAYSRRLI